MLNIEYELSKNFGPIAVSAIMGNIGVEAPSFDYQTQQVGGNGYGLFQLDFLKPHYFKYLAREGKTDSSQSQIQFMISTLNGKDVGLIGIGTANKVLKGLNSGNLTTATKVFMESWEKPGVPHFERRLAKANEIYNVFYGK